MINDLYGQIVYSDQDIIDLLMQGKSLDQLQGILVDQSAIITDTALLNCPPDFKKYQHSDQTLEEFDRQQQSCWHMPEEYCKLDIAAHVLSLCSNQEQLQRCGEELLLYQERNLFDLLRYLKYLVDTMKIHNIIWGVGRGSSVASYVLYLLEVHRIDSMYYNLDIREFLR